MIRPLAALSMLAVLTVPSGTTLAASDEIAPVTAGTRVRLTSGGSTGLSGTAQGTLIRLAPGILGVVDEDRGAIVAVPEATVIRVQTSPGRRRHARTGFLIGAAFGADAVLLATSGPEADCGVERYQPCTPGQRARWAAFGGAIYGGVGALIGHFVRTETWSDVPVARIQLAVGLERGGGRAAVGFSF
jgi:hypothetical protein